MPPQFISSAYQHGGDANFKLTPSRDWGVGSRGFEMSAQLQPISELTQRATEVLVKEIGVVNTLRFLNQMRSGAGDYTAERDQLFEGLFVEEIFRQIKARRQFHMSP
jgi:hypothetical protein